MTQTPEPAWLAEAMIDYWLELTEDDQPETDDDPTERP